MTGLSNLRLGRLEELETFLSSTANAIRGITTGLPRLDKQLKGLQGIVGIIGGPKACKSTLALQVALHNAKKGNPVLFLDKENGLDYMRERIIASCYRVSWKNFCSFDKDKQKKAWIELGRLPFFLYNGPFKIEDVQVCIEELMSFAPEKGHALLVVDSLQKLDMGMLDRRAGIDQWIRDLDALKLKYNRSLVILVTSEKRRGLYNEAAQDGGKESGSIEYTLEMQIDMRVNSEKDQFGKVTKDGRIVAECTINRHGPCGDFWYLEPDFAEDQQFLFSLSESHQDVEIE